MYVQWNLDLTNLHKYNEVRGITNYISSPSNSKNIDIWKRTLIWKNLVQCSKLSFVQSRLWRPKIIKWSQGKLLKLISEAVSVHIIGSQNYISSPSNSKNIDIWKRTLIWKNLVQCSKLSFVQSRLWRPKIIKWSQGKLLKLISEAVSVHIIGSHFCQVSVVFSAENASPEASSFKLLKPSST